MSESHNERANGSDNVSKVITRFPPEQNGYLHIGQSKAIMVNFGFAAHHRSKCYLRFDDTNPKGERQEFYDSIQDIVHWLGFKPARITYSSDNFGRLYELAEKPNRKDGAYVCHCQEAEIRDQRGVGEGEGRLRYACAHQHNITAPSKPKSASFIPSSSLRILSQIQMAFLADMSERSEEICRDVFLDIGFDEVESRAPWPKRQPEAGAEPNHEAQPDEVLFQGMRVGYF